ncbi:MAG: FeoA family protein [Desulfovibrionaceae bacterium]|nr:FeoA family protein [Desulfovibrionaceae bacterium]
MQEQTPQTTACSLRELNVEEKARIVSIKACGELGRRIRDMGLVPGVDVEVIGRAPLRDPIALRISGFTLTLRNNEADLIFVERLK